MKIGIDFGGTMTKLCSYGNLSNFIDLTGVELSMGNETLYCYRVETSQAIKLLDVIAEFEDFELNVTGGGSYKFQGYLRNEFHRTPEMESIVRGVAELNKLPHVLSYINADSRLVTNGIVEYPFLLVNIGSGVSMIKTNSADSYERVDGTPFGGSTFFALCKKLANINHFSELKDLELGNRWNVDLTVGDIYGEDQDSYSDLGLSPNITAGSLGKFGTNETFESSDNDVIDSLLFLTANHISHLSTLVADRNNLDRIVYSGGLLSLKAIYNFMDINLKYYSNSIRNISAYFIDANISQFSGALGCLSKMCE
jgi:type II pantothenate kinase